MKFVDDKGAVNMSNVACKGLPTLGVGTYKGQFIGSTEDQDGLQWVTIATHRGAHIEQSDIDISNIEKNDRIEFKIEARNGAVAVMNGNKYQLVEVDKKSEWMPLEKLYDYIKENNITLAEPKLVSIVKVEDD